LTDFHSKEHSEQNIGVPEANLYTLVLLARFFGSLTLNGSFYFAVSELRSEQNSMKDAGKILGLCFALAFASTLAATAIVSVIGLYAIAFVAITAVIAAVTVMKV